jgi:hypothetical protein
LADVDAKLRQRHAIEARAGAQGDLFDICLFRLWLFRGELNNLGIGWHSQFQAGKL